MKVGIIGGGAAGLTAAWLLEQDCEVTLFERQARLGGHADTVPIKIGNETTLIDAGFEFFSSSMFPNLNRLLTILQVPINSYPLTYTFYEPSQPGSLVIPPLHDNCISWKRLLPCLFDLIDFKRIIDQGAYIVDTHNTNITIEQFIQSIRSLNTSFINDFLYPFLAAGWGAPLDDFKQFAAYDILTWCLRNKPIGLSPFNWSEVVGGTRVYIQALVNQLTKTHIKLGAQIESITRDDGDTYVVKESDNTVSYFDHLILATSAYDAASLLKNIECAMDARSILAHIEYFHTIIAIHGDTNLMPVDRADWSTINVRHSENQSFITVCKPWTNTVPLFRSWISPDEPAPKPLYAQRSYYHPKVTINYFKAQNALELIQSNHNIWFAGMYTTGVDSHDSAILSAVHIAQRLAPCSQRLKALTSR